MNPRRNNLMPHDDGPHDDGSLPPELAAMDAMLGRLAEAERAGGGAGLEDRLELATRSALPGGARDTARVVEGVEALAAHERAGAGVAFEQRIFMATRALVGRRAEAVPGVKVGPGAEVVVRPAGRRFAFTAVVRFAAAVAVVGAGVAAWVSLRPTPAPPSTEDAGLGTVQLAMQVDEKLDTFLAADWSPLTSERLEEIDRDMESLSLQVDGEWFQFGRLAEEEEAM